MKRLVCSATTIIWLVSSGWAQQKVYKPEDFFPLAIGNSWTYRHSYYNLEGRVPVPVEVPDSLLSTGREITVAITHTEEIEGHTYYVFTDLPYDWPPVPFSFFAGKKLRWSEDGQMLVEWWEGKEFPLYNFNLESPHEFPDRDGYTTSVGRSTVFFDNVLHDISFYGRSEQVLPVADRFLGLFGPILLFTSLNFGFDYPGYQNMVEIKHAVINGKKTDTSYFLHPTLVQGVAWGALKNAFHD